ncbi:hypothetical protein D3C80_1267160 [compost metagenome]
MGNWFCVVAPPMNSPRSVACTSGWLMRMGRFFQWSICSQLANSLLLRLRSVVGMRALTKVPLPILPTRKLS